LGIPGRKRHPRQDTSFRASPRRLVSRLRPSML
jgi:hypothetical protein